MKRVRIVSEGHGDSTKILVDGEVLDCVTEVEWQVLAGGVASARLTLFGIEADIEMDSQNVTGLPPEATP